MRSRVARQAKAAAEAGREQARSAVVAAQEQAQSAYQAALDAVREQARTDHRHWRSNLRRDTWAAFLLAVSRYDGAAVELHELHSEERLPDAQQALDQAHDALTEAFTIVELEGPHQMVALAHALHEDGTELKAEYLSSRHRILIERHANIREKAGEGWPVERIARKFRTTEAAVRVALLMPLPPIRFHDLRHGTATMLLASGVDDKFVSEVLGRASVAFTRDVYAVVAEETAADATRRIAAFIPRANRASGQTAEVPAAPLSAVGAITVPSGG